jgi:hypothetical protein
MVQILSLGKRSTMRSDSVDHGLRPLRRSIELTTPHGNPSRADVTRSDHQPVEHLEH